MFPLLSCVNFVLEGQFLACSCRSSIFLSKYFLNSPSTVSATSMGMAIISSFSVFLADFIPYFWCLLSLCWLFLILFFYSTTKLMKVIRSYMAISSLASLFFALLSVDLSPLVWSVTRGVSFRALRLMLMMVGCFCISEEKQIIFYSSNLPKSPYPFRPHSSPNFCSRPFAVPYPRSNKPSESTISFHLGQSLYSPLINITMLKPMIKKQQKKVEPPPILTFKGYYQFLSIDYTCWVYYQGFLFPSVATAFQAARTSDAALRRRISEVKDQEELKNIMAEIKNTPDWPQRRLKVMQQLNRDKFKRNKDLGLKLFATQNRKLVNGYPHGGDAQAFWGAIEVKGEYQGLNTLGKILTTVREEIHQSSDSAKWIEDQNIEADENLWPIVDIIVEREDGSVDTLALRKKGKFIFGWADQCDFKLAQSSSSKFYADMEAVIVDLNSSQGVKIQRGNEQTKLQPLRPQSLQNGDIITFGSSLSRYTLDISYEQVQARLNEKKLEAMRQLQRIQSIKRLQSESKQNEQKILQHRNSIKTLLELKEYSHLYVQGINRNFNYKDIKETFNQYGQVKNIRINIDQKTGKFMGSVLVSFEKIRISEVLENIKKHPIKFDFRVVAVTTEEANKIIATFTNKEVQQKNRKQAEQNQKIKEGVNDRAREKQIPREKDSPRRARRESSSSSSSSSGSSSSSSSSQRSRSRSRRRHDRSHNK